MFFETHIPGHPLREFVEHFIHYEGFAPAHSVDRFLPDGNVEIIIDLNDRPQYIYDNDTLREIQAVRHIWASGVRTEPITIPSGRDSAMLIIAFRKGMAFPFFPVPMDEVADTVIDADLLWGSDFGLLREQFLESKDSPEKFKVVEDFLLRQFGGNLAGNECVGYAVDAMVRSPGSITLGSLSERIGYSQKHFISMFRSRVGITPKSYLRIMRFQKAVIEIEEAAGIDWARLALDCGFYDQAHFINEFKRFSGFTPADYDARRTGELNYVPVG